MKQNQTIKRLDVGKLGEKHDCGAKKGTCFSGSRSYSLVFIENCMKLKFKEHKLFFRFVLHFLGSY